MKAWLVVIVVGLATVARGDAVLLQPSPPMELSGTHGKFDFIKVDAARRRLLACHTGNASLDIIDLTSRRLIKSIPTGAAQGVAIDDAGGRYFVSASKPAQLAIVEADKLEVTGVVPLPAPADLVAYNPGTRQVFVDNDTAPQMWIIDPHSKRLVQTNTFSGAGMEDFCFDKWGTVIFQALKDSSKIAKSDFTEDKIMESWSTAPADKPHGLALLAGGNALLVAGGNGKLVLMGAMEPNEGKILASSDIAPGVDEIAYDPGLHRAYCASGTGQLSVVEVGKDKLLLLGSIPTPHGTHSVAVDVKTHTVWVAFVRGEQAYVQPFAPSGK